LTNVAKIKGPNSISTRLTDVGIFVLSSDFHDANNHTKIEIHLKRSSVTRQ